MGSLAIGLGEEEEGIEGRAVAARIAALVMDLGDTGKGRRDFFLFCELFKIDSFKTYFQFFGHVSKYFTPI